MRPTLPAYRFRVRSRPPPIPQSRNIFVLPFSLVAILVILAIAAPPSLPRSKWFSKLDFRNVTISTPATLNAFLMDSSNSSSLLSSSSTAEYLPVSAAPPTTEQLAPATEAPPVAASDALPTRPVGRRLQAAAIPTSDSSFSTASNLRSVAPPPAPATDAGGPQEANIAYFIQVSSTTVSHLPRLLARIYHSRNCYIIHFDKKVDTTLTDRVKGNIFKKNPLYLNNVKYMPPELITYRGVSMLLNTINAMRELLDFKSDWHYFINLSGADYPLVSQKTIRQMLGRHLEKPLNFLTYAPPDKWEENIAYRLDNIYIDQALTFQEEGGEVEQLDALNPLSRKMKLRYTNAEAWMINSRQLCDFVINSAYARKMLLTFAYSVEASEHYFATLIWNHRELNRTIVNHAMREVIWEHEGQVAGQHPFFIDAKKRDGSFMFAQRMLTAPTFFIRKFRHADSPLMNTLDGRWQDEAHLKAVREKFDWHVQISLEEHAIKPA